MYWTSFNGSAWGRGGVLRRVTPDIDGQLGRREVARVRCGGREHETPAVRLPRAIRRPQPRAHPTDAFSKP